MKKLFAGSLSLFIACAANAGWQYTEWGMTATQVVEASGGKVKLWSGRKEDRLPGTTGGAWGNHTAGDFNFQAMFYFGSNQKLEGVILTLRDDSKCAAMQSAIDGMYGRPYSVQRINSWTTKIWRDEPKNNEVKLLLSPFGCDLTYSPLRGEAAKGL